MNFANMGKERQGPAHSGCQFEQECKDDSTPHETDNNNLLWVARVLEQIYDDTNLKVPWIKNPVPDHLKTLRGQAIQGSLRQNGKSRADLWAFAGWTAVEQAINYRNNLCDGEDMAKYCGGTPEGFESHCGVDVDQDLPGAQVFHNKVFQFGRKDCAEKCTGPDQEYQFCSPASESHPDPHGNGESVTSFMKENFRLTAKESIALMGAHTMGHANEQISGFRHYTWAGPGQAFGKRKFDNTYYKLLTSETAWRRINHQVWSITCFSQFAFCTKLLICVEGKPMTPHW